MSQHKDLTKTRMCSYHLQRRCGLGSNCHFAHSASELRQPPKLAKTKLCPKYLSGICANDNCTYAHGEAELVAQPNYKKKMCHWYLLGKTCRGAKCGFAHDVSELRTGASDDIEPVGTMQQSFGKAALPPRPAMAKANQADGDASTCTPSSRAAPESAATIACVQGTASYPEEHLFRMVAGRGSASLEKQVATMGAALAELQAKVGQVEESVGRTQVGHMQNTISQLSKQCADVEAHLRTTQQPIAPQAGVVAPPLCNEGRLDASVPPMFLAKTKVSRPGDSRKPRATTRTPAPQRVVTSEAPHQTPMKKLWHRRDIKMAIGALIMALWVMFELNQMVHQ